MISFLAPAALGGLALLSLPIILHIFKPKKVREIPFSSLRWLRASQHRLSRRIQWHQVLLFLCRFMLLLCLILAIAKPILAPGGQNKMADRFIILDVSRSMRLQPASRDMPIQTGKKVAEEVLGLATPGDRTTVLLTGVNTTALGPLVRDPSSFLARVRDTNAGLTDTDLTSALAVIKPMLADARPDSVAKLYFLTDNHVNSWSQAAITSFQNDLKVPVEVNVIEVGALSPFNAWIADAKLVETRDKRSIRIRMSMTGRPTYEANLIIKDIPGVQGELSRKITLQQGLTSETDLDLPIDRSLDLRGKIATIVLDPTDGMPEDNTFWLNLDARSGVKVLVIEKKASALAAEQPGFHLRTALAALAAGTGNKIEVIERQPDAVTSEDLYRADVVFLASVPRLPDAVASTLRAKVKAGYGLGIFMGPGLDASFYNTQMYDPLKPSDSLIGSELGAPFAVPAYSKGLARITNIQWSHPILTALNDPVFGDLALAGIRAYYALPAKADESAGRALALIDEKTPLIIERAIGSGRVLIFNTSANDVWSDLPRRKSFLPLIDRTVSYLAGGLIRRTFDISELITIPLTEFKEGTPVQVTSPTGQPVPHKLRSFGGRTVMLIDRVTELGVYSVTAGQPEPIRFIVQAGRGDSNLEVNKSDVLRAWWAPQQLTIVRADEQGKVPALADRTLLWPWFIGAACLFMLLEMFLVHKLCPKMNPGITQSAVAAHGFFRKPPGSVESHGPGGA